MEEMKIELDSDKLKKVIEEIENEALNSFKNGEPYHIVRLRWLRKKLEGTRGIAFILKSLNKRFLIEKDGSWIILRPKKEQS